MEIFAEPMTDGQIEDIQSENVAKIEEFERSIREVKGGASPKEHEQHEEENWADNGASVQETMTTEDQFSLLDAQESSFSTANHFTSGPSQKRNNDGSLHKDNAIKHQDDEDPTPSSSAGDSLVDTDGEDDTETREDDFEKYAEEASGEGFDEELDGDEATENSGEDADCETDEDKTERNNEEDDMQFEIHAAGDIQSPSDIIEMGHVGLRQSISLDEASRQTLTDSDTNSPSTDNSNLDGGEVSEQPHMIGAEVPGAQESPLGTPGELLALRLEVLNKVNDRYVSRPDQLLNSDDWTIEYSLTDETKAKRAWSLYQECKARRRGALDIAPLAEDKVSEHIQMLHKKSRQGAEWRKMMDQEDQARPRVVL